MGNKQDMNASKQTLKDKLMAIILLETSKDYKEMDSDLVSECVDFLMELEGKQKLTKSEIEQRVSKIPFKGKVTTMGSYARKKLRARRLAVVAAVLAFIFALFTIFTFATGNSAVDLLRQMGQTIYEWFDVGSIEYANITFVKPNETKTYPSIEELEKCEKIEILYPSWLPENEEISNVWYLIEGETERYVLQFSNPLYSIEIKNENDLSEDIKSSCNLTEINGISIYYDEASQFIQADFIYNNSWYSVKSDTKDHLFRIIENMKEIN